MTHHLLDWTRRPVWERRLVVPQLHHTWPDLLVRCPHDPEYSVELIELTVSSEKRPFGNHLGEDASNGPDINRSAVLHRPKEDLRGSVPESDNFFGVGPDRNGESSSQTKISNFKIV